MKITHLVLTWSVSRGRDTYGYNIARLDDRNTGARYRCMGGGYDMVGTVVADWMVSEYADRLEAIAGRADHTWPRDVAVTADAAGKLYGLVATYNADGSLKGVNVDGACGIESVQKIMAAIDLELEREYDRRRDTTAGFYVTDTRA